MRLTIGHSRRWIALKRWATAGWKRRPGACWAIWCCGSTICHGPWTLVTAGVVSGRQITSFPSLRIDLRNAGAEVLDQEVVTDEGLVSSRSPDDLPAFCAKIVEEFAEGRHPAQARSA